MAKPFDATLKDLVENYPRDWLASFGPSATGPVTVIDADLSTITTQADKIIRVDDTDPWLMHLDLQAGYDPHLDRRSLKYNVLAHDRHELPVHSVIVLLRPQADAPNLTGRYHYQPAHGQSWVEYRYQVVRLWEQPVETMLLGGLGTLPLAPLCSIAPEALPGVIRRIEARIRAAASPAEAAALWTSTYVLMGLQFTPEAAARLLQGVRDMKESSTYQAILQEGRAEGETRGSITEARRLLLLQGTERFGPPDTQTRRVIERARSISRLENLLLRLLRVGSWQELLHSS